MANLDLNIVRKGSGDGRTHTTFRMMWHEKVIFRNSDLNDPLRVTIQPEPGFRSVVLVDEKGNDVEMPFDVGPRGSMEFTISKRYDGTYFKYTAKIGGANEEDPIVIIEK